MKIQPDFGAIADLRVFSMEINRIAIFHPRKTLVAELPAQQKTSVFGLCRPRHFVRIVFYVVVFTWVFA